MRKLFSFLCMYAYIAAAESNIISFNTIYSDSTGKFSFTYPASLANQATLQKLQKKFMKQKFGEKFLDHKPAAALSLYKSQNKEIEFLYDEVSFPFPGIIQFVNSFYIGGAQSITGSSIGIYSLADGKKIELNNLFNAGWEKNVTKLIIQEFLLSMNLQLLSDYSYTQKESDFKPRSIKLNEKGLEFVFPAYKIAPYVAGEQNIFLSWNSLKPYLDEKSIIYPKLRF